MSTHFLHHQLGADTFYFLYHLKTEESFRKNHFHFLTLYSFLQNRLFFFTSTLQFIHPSALCSFKPFTFAFRFTNHCPLVNGAPGQPTVQAHPVHVNGLLHCWSSRHAHFTLYTGIFDSLNFCFYLYFYLKFLFS